MKKDLRLAFEAARDAQAKFELHEHVRLIYDRLHDDERYRDYDFSVIYKHLTEKE